MDTAVALPPGTAATLQPPLTGNLESLNPVAFVYALLLAVDRGMREGDGDALNGWRPAMLCTSFVFRTIDGDDAKHFVT